MASNQAFKNTCCQLEKSHWKINYIESTEYAVLAYDQHFILIFDHFTQLPVKDFQTEVWQLSDSCQIIDLINHLNNLSWPNSRLLKSVWILCWNTLKLLTCLKKDPINLVLGLENLPLIWILSTLSVSFITSMAYMPDSLSSCSTSSVHAKGAGRFGCLQWLPHSDHSGEGALSVQAILEHKIPNPTDRRNGKMHAIKQIKISAEYHDMLPRHRLDLSGTPGLRPINNSPGYWQTSLGLGSISRYSAQILICMIYCVLYPLTPLPCVDDARDATGIAEVLLSMWMECLLCRIWLCFAASMVFDWHCWSMHKRWWSQRWVFHACGCDHCAWSLWIQPPGCRGSSRTVGVFWAPSQYEDRLIYVWRFPC